MEIVSSSPFGSTSLSSRVPLSPTVLVYIVSRDNPAHFCLGRRNQRCLAIFLDFYREEGVDFLLLFEVT